MTDAELAARVGAVIAGVVTQAVRVAGASGIVLLDDASPEAALARRWCVGALGDDAVRAVGPAEADGAAAWARRRAAADEAGSPTDPDSPAGARSGDADAVLAEEAHRFLARCMARRSGALIVNPVNKTALLLGGSPPPEPILPLGDVYAGQVRALAGGWTAPPPVRELAERAGGIDALDRALARLVDERRAPGDALAALPDAVADAVLRAFEAGRSGRRRVGVVPKLGARTAGIDLFA